MDKKIFFLLPLLCVFFGCSSPAEEKNIPSEKSQEYNIDISEDSTFSQDIPVLMFHYLKDVSPEEKKKNTLHYRLSYSPEKFENMLKFFEKNNITPITFWDLKNAINKEKQLPKNPVILTFDDGYSDHYYNAFRILENFNMKGVFFIVSGNPNVKKWYMTWQQIQEISAAGHEIGSHSVSHVDLTRLSDEALKTEVLESKKEIEKYIQKPVLSFCYPSGRHDDRTVEEVKKYYIFARTTQYGKNFSVENRFQIPALRIQTNTAEKQFEEWFLKK